ncbi:MAG: hypothetical protein APG12_00485 [Candidatus Methanofastidiosum methylothiophilum]|uniref:Uncharacterized protein n=1 Tax=Candidatus Methanofastidiosum methylothiophilum TaxID=1705564 RepID=A0A150ITR1_9EURY|nr:MAG: hypothetical protein APG10_00360 [Candidatus Methanofastidiosum methylthiophilus]KYC48265.1 MAG: hypothetical protein APG11_00504 [Candidatus Methanofastidiosum methylthiophilus]KYC50922.1 MAG: hypothetical protein APG12_00485 [Candidatus Methanofastidiosum methylthiophilus]
METVRQTIRVPKSHEVKIKIPDHIKENDAIEIVLISGLEDRKRGLEELKKAIEDKLFLEDLNECIDDFKYVDAEGLEE